LYSTPKENSFLCVHVLTELYRLYESKDDTGPFRSTGSGRLLTAAIRVRAPVRSCGICGGQSGIWTGFLLRFPLPIIPPIAPHSSSSSIVIWGWYNRPVAVSVIVDSVSLHPKKEGRCNQLHTLDGTAANAIAQNNYKNVTQVDQLNLMLLKHNQSFQFVIILSKSPSFSFYNLKN
jgi:hypothetical protein